MTREVETELGQEFNKRVDEMERKAAEDPEQLEKEFEDPNVDAGYSQGYYSVEMATDPSNIHVL